VGQNLQDLGSVVEVEAHDGPQGNQASDGKVRRLWRRVAVPGEGPANRRGYRVHEHQGAMVVWFPYLDRSKRWRRVLSTTRPSSGGTGEGRFGVGAIPARGWPGLDWIKLGNKGRR
jgi:hypothetical protein